MKRRRSGRLLVSTHAADGQKRSRWPEWGAERRCRWRPPALTRELGGGLGGGGFRVYWRDDAAAEERVKAETRATIRCFPLDLNGPGAVAGRACFLSGAPATHVALFARAF